jgi:hypothetical protein
MNVSSSVPKFSADEAYALNWTITNELESVEAKFSTVCEPVHTNR